MADVMLTLGSFKFHIGSASYSELQRVCGWRWQGQARIGRHDLLQATGRDNPQVTLTGVISTTFRSVGVRQLDELEALGNQLKPHRLTSGLGDVLGFWVIVSLDASHSKFLPGGLPRRQTFTLTLKYYGDDLQNP